MRLRYLHLPRCGPLTDTAVVFGREEVIAKALNLPRQGALNFIVGVNGTGKSSLLRALYRIFRSLKNNEIPPTPLTLAWDIAPANETVTAILHVPEDPKVLTYFLVHKQVRPDATKARWQQLTQSFKVDDSPPEALVAPVRGDYVLGSLLQAHLPKRLIAYTSGGDESWLQLDQPVFHPKQDNGDYHIEDERPPGWSLEQEWEEEQPIRISNILTRYAVKSSSAFQTVPGMTLVGEWSGDIVARMRQELEPFEKLRQKVSMNRLPRPQRPNDFYFRIRPGHLRHAGIAMALLQTAKELAGCTEASQREALRNELIQQRGSEEKQKDARRVLNEIDWFWPTHLSLTYRDADDRVSPLQHQELLCLVALADEVIAQPRGRNQAIIALGPKDNISLSEKLKEAFPLGIPSRDLELIAGRVDGCATGAEAVLRAFSADKEMDSTPMDVFSRLRDWERTGLLEEVTLTVRRISRADPDNEESDDQTADDIIVTYDQLSDGEQMLLGRMGLLFLLRGQDGSLLLLDEPETHFNDVWKREIVDMIDMGLLNSTQANVIIATHTSIALTDAFAAEVTVLDKSGPEITARAVAGGLFGTDPGEVTMNLFRADSSTGSRSVEILDRLLKTDWAGREAELQKILDLLGSSFHRAELRAILKKLDTSHGSPQS